MKRRNLIQMTDEEIQAFLAEKHILQVATIDHDGFPHLVAMWYVLIDGQIAFWTYAKSQKAINLRRDQRLACLVESGELYQELRGVQIKGEAVLNEDRAVVQRVGEGVWKRYHGPLNDNVQQMIESQSAKRIAIFVTPIEIASWDHRKLGGTY